jgi:ubiquinol-cytochrome c reductase cytochrome b/c1 subunit
MNNPTDRSQIRNIGLFFVLVILVNGLIIPGATSPKDLMATFYLALFVHVGFTIYDGSFDALRTATWLLLIGTWAGSEALTFWGFMVPWGQVAFWLATVPLVGDVLAYTSDAASILGGYVPWSALPLLVLGLDIAVMHYDRWRRSSLLRVAIFLASVGAAAIVLGLALNLVIDRSAPSGPDVATGQLPIVPPWHSLPFYALLRAVPSKLGGVVLMFAAMLVLMVWPWMRADMLRMGRTRAVWPLLCLALAAAWIGLGYLGSRPADDATIRAAQALAVFYLAFFLVLPRLLGRFAGRAATT